MVSKPWRIIPRPLLETILNNHAQHHRVPQPLILHGPRGVGKTTLILERLLEKWNTGPHLTAYVDFAQPIESHHPSHGHSFPWTSWSTCPSPPLQTLQTHLENRLESMAHTGVKLGAITSHQIFTILNKWHGLNASLRHILQSHSKSPKVALSDKLSSSVLWGRAVCAASARLSAGEVEGIGEGSMEEVAYFKEAMAGLRVAKEVIRFQQGWRGNAVRELNRVGGFSRSLANSATDWPCLLLELLSSGAEIDYFQVNLLGRATSYGIVIKLVSSNK